MAYPRSPSPDSLSRDACEKTSDSESQATVRSQFVELREQHTADLTSIDEQVKSLNKKFGQTAVSVLPVGRRGGAAPLNLLQELAWQVAAQHPLSGVKAD